MQTREDIRDWSTVWFIHRAGNSTPVLPTVNDPVTPLEETLPRMTNQCEKWTTWWIQYVFHREESSRKAFIRYAREHFTIKYESYADILSLGTRKTYFTVPREIEGAKPDEADIYDFFPPRATVKPEDTGRKKDGILSHGFAHLRGSYPMNMRSSMSDADRKEFLKKYGLRKRPVESMFWKS